MIAFHPDSDFGPAPEDHPMINRTMVDGVSASRLDDIRTADCVTAHHGAGLRGYGPNQCAVSERVRV